LNPKNKKDMFPKFKLKRDWFIETDILGIKNKTLLFGEGQQFTATDNGEYHITHGGWSETNPKVGGRMILSMEEMKLANDINGELIFQEVVENELKISVNEISTEEEEVVKSWRIQLDVKTTQSKLKEIQKVLEKEIKYIIEI
jgi:glucan biosynthesis protein